MDLLCKFLFFGWPNKKKKNQDSTLGNDFPSLLNTDEEPLDFNKQDAVSVTVTTMGGACFLI